MIEIQIKHSRNMINILQEMMAMMSKVSVATRGRGGGGSKLSWSDPKFLCSP